MPASKTHGRGPNLIPPGHLPLRAPALEVDEQGRRCGGPRRSPHTATTPRVEVDVALLANLAQVLIQVLAVLRSRTGLAEGSSPLASPTGGPPLDFGVIAGVHSP